MKMVAAGADEMFKTIFTIDHSQTAQNILIKIKNVITEKMYTFIICEATILSL